MTQWFFTKYSTTGLTITNKSEWWDDNLSLWGEPYEPQKQNKESKCSVQEPPRKKDIRFLNRST